MCEHLRIKNTGSSLNNTNSPIESLNLIHLPSLTRHNGNDIELQIGRMKIRGKGKRKSLFLSRRNLNIISRTGDIPDNQRAWVSARCQWLETRQCASDDCDLYWFFLTVGEIEECLCRVAIDQLYAEDLGLREGGGDCDVEIGGCGWDFDLFLDLEREMISYFEATGEAKGGSLLLEQRQRQLRRVRVTRELHICRLP